jgi:NAD(P)H-hydrate repair Nnr-like enzyme with NAD(P)H-hydrate epimerase domain
MRVLTVEQMRAADRAAVAEAHIPEMLLMTRAGTALARVAARVAALRGTRSAVLIAGHGNNGGDAFVAARCLFDEGFSVQVLMTCVPATLKGAAREAWDRCAPPACRTLCWPRPELARDCRRLLRHRAARRRDR